MATYRLRKNVERLAPAELDALRDAYTKMQALREDDNRSWAAWAGIHGWPRGACWHHARIFNGNRGYSYDLFLPWHRAYLINFEHSMMDRNADASLPWWDWAKGGVPASFDVAVINGAVSPLYSGPVPDSVPNRAPGRTRRFPGQVDPPFGRPSQLEVQDALDLPDFEDFSAAVQGLHDTIHPWTGGQSGGVSGDMGMVVASAYDPIFWSHHCFVDRLWYLWQQRWGVNNIPATYLGRPLAPFALRVEDVLDIHNLGYDYAGASTTIVVPGPV